MALRTISTDSSNSNELPWINEYVEQGGAVGDVSFVTHVKKSSNGLLILAEEYKGFVFAKSQMAKYLMEALGVWVSNSTANYPLYAVVDKGGKLSLAVDDEESLTIWIEETKGKSWEQKRKKNPDAGLDMSKLNAFLPTPPPTTKVKRKVQKEEHPDLNAMPY